VKALDNEQIVNLLRGDRRQREDIIRQLYYDPALKGAMIKLLSQNNGSKDDFDNLISQTLIRFYKTCISNKSFVLKTNYVSYILGIANFVWIKELNNKSKHAVEELNSEYEIIEDAVDVQFLEAEKRTIIKGILSKLGQNCKEVLMFWSQSYSMVEIAEKMGYKSPGMAKKKKHICMKELYAFIEHNPEIIDLLK
jgi:DNA-directed RNA polymerase specialized sigma24 family protein